MNTKILSREDILKISDIKTELVEVPEWGGSVYVRGLTGTQRDLFEESILEQNGKKTRVKMKNARAKLVSLSAVDEDGKLVFSQTDIEMLGAKNAAALDRIYEVASRLSGISDEDMDELVKNYVSDQSEDSTSA